MAHAHDHSRPPSAKVRLHLQYPYLQGTVLNQVQGHIYLDLSITVLT